MVEDEENESEKEELLDDFKVKLQSAIANMSPAKFEQLSRSLLTRMGVQFTNKGVFFFFFFVFDGYGYHIQFLGAMNKYQADYGVFITNSRFTNNAREAARAGTPITLIDGNELIKLIIRYELYITPVTTYVLDDFYDD